MAESNSEKKQGWILTEKGREKITDALEKYYQENGKNLTQEKIQDMTRLNEKTFRKIRNGKETVRGDSIKRLFRGLNLTLETGDYETGEDSPDAPPSKSDAPSELDDGLTRWVGRETLIAELVEKLQGECRVLSIVGITGIGKTSLAGQLAKNSTLREFLPYLKEVSFYQESSPSFTAVAQLVLGDELLRSQPQLLATENEDALVEAMILVLQSQSFLLIIDMIEVVLEPDGKDGHQFIEPVFAKFLERFVLAQKMPTRIIFTSQDRPPVMAQGRFLNRYDREELRGLTETEAMELFCLWDVDVEGEQNQSYLGRIIAVYEGHPLALQVIAGEIRSSPYDGSVAAYWNEYGYEVEEVERLKTSGDGDPREDKPNLAFSGELQRLVQTRIDDTFERLRRGYPLACRLLCMGALNRKPAERRAWLLLLSRFPQEKRVLAFETLKQRFFLETELVNDKVFYRLHGLMRRVALDKLPELEREVMPE